MAEHILLPRDIPGKCMNCELLDASDRKEYPNDEFGLTRLGHCSGSGEKIWIWSSNSNPEPSCCIVENNKWKFEQK